MGDSPLEIAVGLANHSILGSLLNSGAVRPEHPFEVKLLLLAAAVGHENIVHYLLERGVNIDDYEKALCLSAWVRRHSIAKLLQERGVKTADRL